MFQGSPGLDGEQGERVCLTSAPTCCGSGRFCTMAKFFRCCAPVNLSKLWLFVSSRPLIVVGVRLPWSPATPGTFQISGSGWLGGMVCCSVLGQFWVYAWAAAGVLDCCSVLCLSFQGEIGDSGPQGRDGLKVFFSYHFFEYAVVTIRLSQTSLI